MIEFENVFINYTKDFFTLYDFSMKVKKYDHILLIGDVDSGSYSILRILAKFDKHYTGNVTIETKDLKVLNDKELNLSYIPSCPVLFENKTVIDNLIYPLIIRKIKKTISTKLAIGLLNEFGLTEIKDKKVKTLNDSTKIIISLLRAMIRENEYVLIEDLFINLEKSYHELVNKIIAKLANSKTVIAISNEDKLDFNCYNDYHKIKLEYGVKQKTTN